MAGSGPEWQRGLWKACKAAVSVSILAAVAWAFYRALSDLQDSDIAWQPAWLVLAGVLYLVSAAFSVAFWIWSMRRLGQDPSWLIAARAYLVGTLGKYVPGKALAILLRTALVRGPRVRITIAAVTVVYETLIYMAAAAAWAAAVLGWRYGEEAARLQVVLRTVAQAVHLPTDVLQLWHVLVVVMAAACLPTVPVVYSMLIRSAVRPFQRAEAEPLPVLPASFFPVGIVLGGATWAVSGLGLWTAVQAVHGVPMTWALWTECTAYLGLATVIGFFTPVPAGLGVRELVLLALLMPELGEGPAALVALLFRLTWMVSEIVAAAGFLPFTPRQSAA